MNHTIQAEGYGIRLRPVRIEDSAFIVWLRNLEHARGRIGDSAADVAAQEAWLKRYFERDGDYYFIVETPGKIPVGTYGIYNHEGSIAESGRWVIRPEVRAAIPSLLVAFDEIAFGALNLSQIRGSTVSTNHPALSVNAKFGFRQTHIEKSAQIIGGTPVDLVHFLLEKKDWPPARDRLLPLARLAERQILEWEAANLVK
jgi:RimJ/RimL family protein N-acetyltransferase